MSDQAVKAYGGIHIHAVKELPRDTMIAVPPPGPCPRCGLFGCPDDPRKPVIIRNIGTRNP